VIAREQRLRRGEDFERARRDGVSHSSSLLVLIVSPNGLDRNRFGVTAGRRLGSAVLRNRAKRLLREALREIDPRLCPGHDIVVIARNRFRATTTLAEVREQLLQLARRAEILEPARGIHRNGLG
jgi:ribonuclease P protein component